MLLSKHVLFYFLIVLDGNPTIKFQSYWHYEAWFVCISLVHSAICGLIIWLTIFNVKDIKQDDRKLLYIKLILFFHYEIWKCVN